MKKLIPILLLILFTISCNKPNDTETNFYLIRHADKDLSDKTNKNPSLSEKGKKRANAWANYFEDKDLNTIYSTNYNRTKETANVIAKKLNLTIEYYHPFKFDTDSLIEKHKNKTILIVGHSNTSPNIANQLLKKKKYNPMHEDDYVSFFKVTVKKDSITSNLMLLH